MAQYLRAENSSYNTTESGYTTENYAVTTSYFEQTPVPYLLLLFSFLFLVACRCTQKQTSVSQNYPFKTSLDLYESSLKLQLFRVGKSRNEISLLTAMESNSVA